MVTKCDSCEIIFVLAVLGNSLAGKDYMRTVIDISPDFEFLLLSGLACVFMKDESSGLFISEYS